MGHEQIKSACKTIAFVIVLLTATSMILPHSSSPMSKNVNDQSFLIHSLPFLTTAATINSGTYLTRNWITEKHVYNSTGVPSNGTLVEIQNAILSNIANGAASGDCNDPSDTPSPSSGTWCDSTADANDGTGTVHIEIDQVYKYLGIAPTDWPANGTTVNITGYTFYDGETGGTPTNPIAGGWEIHPVVEWSMSNASSNMFNLSVSEGSGGSTTPGSGSYAEPSGSIVIVTAIPSSGYNFRNFSEDGQIVTTNPIQVTMNTNHVLKPNFISSSSTNVNSSNPSSSTYQASLLLYIASALIGVTTVLGADRLRTRLHLRDARRIFPRLRKKS